MSLDHHNHEYDGGSPNLPEAVGDRYYGQDMARDFHHLRDVAGKVLEDLFDSFPIYLSGGIVTQGTGDTLDITPALGYVELEVDVPDSFAALPPTVKQETLTIRVNSTQQTNMTVPSATLDDSTVNYVKLAFVEVDGNSRSRAKKAGSYNYEQARGFVFTVDATPATDKEIVLATFTGAVSGSWTITDLLPLAGIEAVIDLDNVPNGVVYQRATNKGFMQIVLTNYPTTGKPAIAAGGSVEINGTLYINPIEVTITGSTANTTWYDILLTPSGTTFTASFIARNTGVWSDSKQGLYSGNNRVVACAYRRGSDSDWINKNILQVINRTVEVKMEIGDWNMDADPSVNVTHGCTSSKIRQAWVTINHDDDPSYYPLIRINTSTFEGDGAYMWSATVFVLSRSSTGLFDNAFFNATSFNRGWVVVRYEV